MPVIEIKQSRYISISDFSRLLGLSTSAVYKKLKTHTKIKQQPHSRIMGSKLVCDYYCEIENEHGKKIKYFDITILPNLYHRDFRKISDNNIYVYDPSDDDDIIKAYHKGSDIVQEVVLTKETLEEDQALLSNGESENAASITANNENELNQSNKAPKSSESYRLLALSIISSYKGLFFYNYNKMSTLPLTENSNESLYKKEILHMKNVIFPFSNEYKKEIKNSLSSYYYVSLISNIFIKDIYIEKKKQDESILNLLSLVNSLNIDENTISNQNNKVHTNYYSSSQPQEKGSQPYEKGSQPYEKGSQPYEKGSQPYEKGSQPYGKGSQPDEKGSQPYEKGSQPYEKGSQPYEKGSQPYEKGSQPYEKGSQPYEKGSQPDEKGSQPDEKGSQPYEKGSQPQEKGSQPQEKGSQPQEKGSQPYEKGSQPDEKGSQPDEKGSQPYEKGSQPYEKGSQPYEKGSQPDEKGSQPQEKGSQLENNRFTTLRSRVHNPSISINSDSYSNSLSSKLLDLQNAFKPEDDYDTLTNFYNFDLCFELSKIINLTNSKIISDVDQFNASFEMLLLATISLLNGNLLNSTSSNETPKEYITQIKLSYSDYNFNDILGNDTGSDEIKKYIFNIFSEMISKNMLHIENVLIATLNDFNSNIIISDKIEDNIDEISGRYIEVSNAVIDVLSFILSSLLDHVSNLIDNKVNNESLQRSSSDVHLSNNNDIDIYKEFNDSLQQQLDDKQKLVDNLIEINIEKDLVIKKQGEDISNLIKVVNDVTETLKNAQMLNAGDKAGFLKLLDSTIERVEKNFENSNNDIIKSEIYSLKDFKKTIEDDNIPENNTIHNQIEFDRNKAIEEIRNLDNIDEYDNKRDKIINVLEEDLVPVEEKKKGFFAWIRSIFS